jgi:hypothetical protein
MFTAAEVMGSDSFKAFQRGVSTETWPCYVCSGEFTGASALSAVAVVDDGGDRVLAIPVCHACNGAGPVETERRVRAACGLLAAH